ncbi:MAG: hypothetical protein HKN33_06710, partial [Pyrinomonadaceae bacterium]|nr:hypothetical protein [Pyrinomonadaceae bacterium]
MSSPATSKSNYIKLLIIVSGAISAAAGLFALYGWTGDNHLFTALIEGAPRLHFLPAVSFVIAGVSVVLTVIKRKTPAVILSYLLILIAVFEILHFAVGHQAGIDGFAVIFGFEESEFHMTLIGSLAFLFVGLAIAARWRTKKRSAIVSGSFGAFSLACGLGTLLAYSSGYLEHMKWNPSTELSIPGAVAFLVLGVAIIAQSSHRQMNLRTDWKHFVPVVLLVVGLTLSFVMRHYFHAKDVVSVQNTVSIELRSLSKTIESEINDRLVANERMARRWAVHGGTERPEWEKDAKRLYRDYGGYQAVEWVDPDYKVRWIIPFEPNKRALGLDLGATPNRLWAVKKAKETRKSVVSEPITLV